MTDLVSEDVRKTVWELVAQNMCILILLLSIFLIISYSLSKLKRTSVIFGHLKEIRDMFLFIIIEGYMQKIIAKKPV